MAQFYTLLTQVGQAKLANAVALGETIALTHLAVGDGGGTLPTPDSNRTSLVNEVRRAPINLADIDPDNPNWIVVEQVLPPDIGGWTIREIGVFDSAGDLIAYGNYPETYKPTLDEGSGRTQTVRMVLQVSDTAAVTLRVDPSVVLATRKYVDDGDETVAQAAAEALQDHEGGRDHPAATTSEQGMVQLATLEEMQAGERDDRAADPAGVKAAIEYAFNGPGKFATYGNGYQVLPSGLIIQWSGNARPSGGNANEHYPKDFPIPFPNVCMSIVAVSYSGVADKTFPICADVVNNATYKLSWGAGSEAGTAANSRMIAIGY